MSEEHEKPYVIIRRVKKIKKGGHHGGSWKIAYADFVTAMMTFFLLMWLLTLVNKYQLDGIAEYFKKPLKEAFTHQSNKKNKADNREKYKEKEKEKFREKEKNKEKPDKVVQPTLNAKEQVTPQNFQQSITPPKMERLQRISEKTPNSQVQSNQAMEVDKDKAPIAQGTEKAPSKEAKTDKEKTLEQIKETRAAEQKELNEKDIKEAKTIEQKELDKELEKLTLEQKKQLLQLVNLKKNLQEDLAKDPAMQQFKNQLNFVVTADGLKIELRDLENHPMFSTGKADFQNYAKNVVGWLAQKLNTYPNHVMIIGHTDSAQYAPGAHYSNWELSADRANATRRELVEQGMDENKIVRVVGVGDTEPLDKTNGLAPKNRRIEIIVLTNEANRRLAEHPAAPP